MYCFCSGDGDGGDGTFAAAAAAAACTMVVVVLVGKDLRDTAVAQKANKGVRALQKGYILYAL